jgi:hypothetical protein
MKRFRISVAVFAVAVLVVSFAAALAVDRNENRQPTEPLTVEMLTKSAKKFVGHDVTVKGVVGSVSAEKKYFTIVDKTGCGGCPSKRSCGVSEFKVSYKGDLPKRKKQVEVTGRLVEIKDGGYLLEASKIQ